MRLYHPKTLEILANRPDISKRYSSSVWNEIFKWKASGQKHPKMFIDNDEYLGIYLRSVYENGIKKGCNLDINLIKKLSSELQKGFSYLETPKQNTMKMLN